MKRVTILILLAPLAALAPSCGDPVHDARVSALGPEASGVSPGPTHRPGQPCVECHGGKGPAGTEFALAGTIFKLPGPSPEPFANVTVSIFEATQDQDADVDGGGGGAPKVAQTNAAGNFFIRRADWSPTYPLHHITLSVEGSQFAPVMATTIGRDGSCATCHFDPAQRSSPGHVYFTSDPADLPGGGP